MHAAICPQAGGVERQREGRLGDAPPLSTIIGYSPAEKDAWPAPYDGACARPYSAKPIRRTRPTM